MLPDDDERDDGAAVDPEVARTAQLMAMEDGPMS
jgi:hypothetical protein